jgi:hypothetical protein
MSAWLNQFQVGDLVEFEMAGKPRCSDEPNEKHPRWNGAFEDNGSSGKTGYGIVCSCSIQAVKVESEDITQGWWYFLDPFGDIPPGYVTLRNAAPVVVVPALYSVPLPTCFPKESIPPSVMASLVDQGERAVRRVLREWPYGKELKYRTVNNTLEWYFQ